MPGLFDIDYDVVVFNNIPPADRDAVTYAWLKALIAPVKSIDDAFQTNRNNNLYRLAHNGQVCYLTAVLNDTFDPVDRGIYINDGVFDEPIYVFLDAEEEPVYIDLEGEIGTGVIEEPDPVSCWLESEVVTIVYFFIVHVPTAVESLPGYSETWLRSVIDEYRLPSRGQYQVVYF